MAAHAKAPSFLFVPARVFLFTLLAGLLSFAVSLLLGILGILIVAKGRGVHPDLTFAYRQIALPVAVVAAAVVLVCGGVVEVRHYRQAKALAGIERMG